LANAFSGNVAGGQVCEGGVAAFRFLFHLFFQLLTCSFYSLESNAVKKVIIAGS
jgi:hypothetical protein